MKKALRQSATLLVGLLFASSSILYSVNGEFAVFVVTPEEAAEIMLNQQAEVQKEVLAKITDQAQINQKLLDFLDLRQETLKKCEGPAANDKVCEKIISFFEQMVSLYSERRAALEAAANETSSSSCDLAAKIEAASASVAEEVVGALEEGQDAPVQA